MEFRETLLVAQRNQQQKSSESLYYKARFDPPKKEQKQRDKLSANIQKFLAKKDEEEKQKKLDTQRKRDELLAMRDPKALRKIQKTLKVIKSANKSVLEDAVDRDNTAFTLTGPDQPDQDDYGYESQEAAAIYAKMMQKYSKIPDVPKFPTGSQGGKKDLKGTMERVKHALQHEDDPVPHKRRRRTENGSSNIDKQDSPTPYEPEKKEEKSKPEKPKFRKPMPPPMDFNQLLKLAEQKKTEPLGAQAAQKKQAAESENVRPMTKKQRREYEEEMARRQRRQERLDADKGGGRKPQREDKPAEKERPEQRPSGFGRIPKLNDKNSDRNNSPKPVDKINKGDRDRVDRDKADKQQREKDRMRQERERLEREKDRVDREKDKIDRERLERLKAERERIDRELEQLSKDKERLDKTEKRAKMENGRMTDKPADRTKLNSSDNVKKSIDLKSQNTYRIDKNSNEKKLSSKNDDKFTNGHSSQGKHMPKSSSKEQIPRNGVKDKAPLMKQRPGEGKSENGKRPPDNKVPSKRPDDRALGKPQAGSSKPQLSNSFDFDRHVNSLKKEVGKNGGRPSGDVKRKPPADDARRKQNRRVVDSESEYDSEMDDFIDDGEENMDYSRHIKEIFGYDKSKYRDMDDDDDPTMESSFARQQREEFISKKLGIMEDLEDMRMEAMEKKKSKKKRRISDD